METIKEWFNNKGILLDINSDLTFEAVMRQPYNFYDMSDCGESDIRQMVFEEISEIYGISYEVIYDSWLSENNDCWVLVRDKKINLILE